MKDRKLHGKYLHHMSKLERMPQGTKPKSKKRKGKEETVKIDFLKLIVNDEIWEWDKVNEQLEKEGKNQYN